MNETKSFLAALIMPFLSLIKSILERFEMYHSSIKIHLEFPPNKNKWNWQQDIWNPVEEVGKCWETLSKHVVNMMFFVNVSTILNLTKTWVTVWTGPGKPRQRCKLVSSAVRYVLHRLWPEATYDWVWFDKCQRCCLISMLLPSFPWFQHRARLYSDNG